MVQYEFTDHTADIGIRFSAPDLPALFAEAAHALYHLISGETGFSGERETAIRVDGADWPDLMVNWLRELLYLHTGEGMLVRRVCVLSLNEYQICARIYYDEYSPDRPVCVREIKAVT